MHLAKLLRRGGNTLLLDEPTNDLDVDTLRALEEALLAFPGCAVIISHDRWFLDRVATHVLAFEGDSQVTWFEGNFEAYEENRHARLGAEADRPHRISYKKLVRVVSLEGGAAPVLIRHFTDPSCPFAFSAERQRLRLLWLYGAQIEWELHMVVLAEERPGDDFPPERVSKTPARGSSCSTGCRSTGGRSRSRASLPACRAVVATRLHAPDREAALPAAAAGAQLLRARARRPRGASSAPRPRR